MNKLFVLIQILFYIIQGCSALKCYECQSFAINCKDGMCETEPGGVCLYKEVKKNPDTKRGTRHIMKYCKNDTTRYKGLEVNKCYDTLKLDEATPPPGSPETKSKECPCNTGDYCNGDVSSLHMSSGRMCSNIFVIFACVAAVAALNL